MKFIGSVLLSAAFFGSFCSLLVFYITHTFPQKPITVQNFINQELVTQNQKISKPISPGLPVFLIIPSINIYAKIQEQGINSNGNMEVPNNIVDTSWFKLGSRPGEKGSAVIAGHLDGKNGKGVFANLNKLKIGDKLYVKDNNGVLFSFVVRQRKTYNPGYAEEIFSSNDGAHLNLITCDGVWNQNKKSYDKRLVVFADFEEFL